jgi:hypothetical protein
MQTNEHYVKTWAAFECGKKVARAEQGIEDYKADLAKFGNPNNNIAENIVHNLKLALGEAEKADLAPELIHNINNMYNEWSQVDLENF